LKIGNKANIMTLKKLYEKVSEVGSARAYFSNRSPGDDTFYYGQRGDLKIDEDGFLYFSADCGADKDEKHYLGKSASDIHAPSIGHYNF
jgi:hypothetical protein